MPESDDELIEMLRRRVAKLEESLSMTVLAVRMASKHANGQITYRLLDLCDEAEKLLKKEN